MADIQDVMAMLMVQGRTSAPPQAAHSPEDVESTLLAAYGGPRKQG
jgi:hypothetical protein